MKEFFAMILASAMVVLLITVVATFGGTLVWLCWPVVGAVFPRLVQEGYLAPRLGWFDAVMLTWLSAFLVKSTTSLKEGKKSA